MADEELAPGKDELMQELRDAIDSQAAKPASGVEENVEIRTEDTPVSDEPGGISFQKDGEERFDGLLQDVNIESPEDLANALDQITEQVNKEREETGRVGTEKTTSPRG